MWLPRTALVLEEAEAGIAGGGFAGSPLESYLSQFLLIVMYSEMEATIKKLVSDGALRSTNAARRQYYQNHSAKSYRGLKKADLSDFLGGFCEPAKAHLAAVDSRTVTQYSNLLANRHAIAHGDGSQVTLREAKDAYLAATAFLGQFDASVAIAYATLEPDSPRDPI
jgi:hypothetical protein